MIPILYTDEHIVVCVKPAGALSQDSGENSVPQMLREELGVQDIYTIHRLDREVGGVMVYARSQSAAAALSRAVQEHKLQKDYMAVLQAVPAQTEGTLTDLLFHDKTKNKTYVVKRERKGVKEALLDYRVLETAGKKCLVQVHLHTGRTHQIRVQFASRRMPLTGDRKYGGGESASGLGLWSIMLRFPHPNTGEMMTFQAYPPEELPWSEFTAVKY